MMIVSDGSRLPPTPNPNRLQEDHTMSNTVNNARKVRITSQQVAFLALTEGVGAVETLHGKPGCEIAPATFAAAVELLATQPETAAALSALADALAPESSGERGRPAAKVGESRTYRVQEVNDSGAFIRLPVGLLGLAKGGVATVTFDNGVIRVKA
jgi:hypothetical protein